MVGSRDTRVRIPMLGQVNSLNVATSAAIVTMRLYASAGIDEHEGCRMSQPFSSYQTRSICRVGWSGARFQHGSQPVGDSRDLCRLARFGYALGGGCATLVGGSFAHRGAIPHHHAHTNNGPGDRRWRAESSNWLRSVLKSGTDSQPLQVDLVFDSY